MPRDITPIAIPVDGLTDQAPARVPTQGRNCVLSATGYSSISVFATGLDYGPNLEASEDEAANRRAMYVTRLDDDEFVVTIKMAEREYSTFCTWLMHYGVKRASTYAPVGPLWVSIPDLGFLRSGIPSGPLAVGADHIEFFKEFALSFTGTTAATTAPVTNGFKHLNGADSSTKRILGGHAFSSEPTIPQKDPQSKFFYPTGIQQSLNPNYDFIPNIITAVAQATTNQASQDTKRIMGSAN